MFRKRKPKPQARQAAKPAVKLTAAEKREISRILETSRGDGKVHSAQDTLPFRQMYPDGLCKLDDHTWSKCIEFEDEADLMALTEDGEKAETPIVCTCTEKCQAGAVNTACPVCVKNLSECVGTEQKAAEPTEPENPEPEKKSNTGAILAVLLILAAGGGAAVYFLVLKPKQGKKVPADLDDFDLEDEEEYLTEDEETEEKNE